MSLAGITKVFEDKVELLRSKLASIFDKREKRSAQRELNGSSSFRTTQQLLSGRYLLLATSEGTPVTVYDKEPTSIVAYFLSTG